MQYHLPLQRHANADHNSSCAKQPLFQFPRRVHPWRSRSLTQPARAQHAQSNARSSLARPSLDLKELEKLEANLLKDATSSSRSTADKRIAFINPPSASGPSSSPRRASEKDRQPRSASAGPVRLKGAKGGKQGKDMTERLSKVRILKLTMRPIWRACELLSVLNTCMMILFRLEGRRKVSFTFLHVELFSVGVS